MTANLPTWADLDRLVDEDPLKLRDLAWSLVIQLEAVVSNTPRRAGADCGELEVGDRYRSLVATDTQTCYACPTQWEGQLHDGRHFYFRYRHGWASLALGHDRDWVTGHEDVGMAYGDHLQGVLNDSEYHRLFLALVDQAATEVSR